MPKKNSFKKKSKSNSNRKKKSQVKKYKRKSIKLINKQKGGKPEPKPEPKPDIYYVQLEYKFPDEIKVSNEFEKSHNHYEDCSSPVKMIIFVNMNFSIVEYIYIRIEIYHNALGSFGDNYYKHRLYKDVYIEPNSIINQEVTFGEIYNSNKGSLPKFLQNKNILRDHLNNQISLNFKSTNIEIKKDAFGIPKADSKISDISLKLPSKITFNMFGDFSKPSNIYKIQANKRGIVTQNLRDRFPEFFGNLGKYTGNTYIYVNQLYLDVINNLTDYERESRLVTLGDNYLKIIDSTTEGT